MLTVSQTKYSRKNVYTNGTCISRFPPGFLNSRAISYKKWDSLLNDTVWHTRFCTAQIRSHNFCCECTPKVFCQFSEVTTISACDYRPHIVCFSFQLSARCPRLVVDKLMSIEMKPATPNSGEQHFSNEAIQGTLAFLHCPKGYHIQGQSVVVCHESQWLPSTDARCEKSIYPILPTEWLFRLPW